MNGRRWICIVLIGALLGVAGPLFAGMPQAAGKEETIVGSVVKGEKGVVIEAEDGDYLVKGKDLSKMVGKMVEATGSSWKAIRGTPSKSSPSRRFNDDAWGETRWIKTDPATGPPPGTAGSVKEPSVFTRGRLVCLETWSRSFFSIGTVHLSFSAVEITGATNMEETQCIEKKKEPPDEDDEPPDSGSGAPRSGPRASFTPPVPCRPVSRAAAQDRYLEAESPASRQAIPNGTHHGRFPKTSFSECFRWRVG